MQEAEKTQDTHGDTPTLAIATGILGRATESGVRGHIRFLCGGRTVVLCERLDPRYTPIRPTFVHHPRHSLLDRVEFEIGKPVSILRYQSLGVPFGRKRKAMTDFLRQHRAAAILAEFGHIGGNLWPIARELSLPIFVYFRGFDASKRLNSPRIVRRYKAMIPHVAGLVSVSQSLLDNLAAVGVTHPNTAVIPTGVDTDLFRPGEKDPHLLLAVGRIIAKKAPMITVEAFAAVAGDFPSHRLEVVGDGEMRAACEARVRELGLGERIVFHGQRDHDFVRARMARAAVFLQHSVTDEAGNTEGLPTAVQEAMASGAVVVSTYHAGIPEAVTPGRTGLLVAERDTAGFAAAIGDLLRDPEGAAGMGRAARLVAEERFDFRKLHGRLEALIRADCARLGVPSPDPL